MREALFGLVGGTLIGSTGIGTGSLLTPLLIMSGYQPSVAVSTGLASLIVSKLTGSIAHRSLGNWPGRQAWLVVAGGILGVTVVASLALAGLSPNDVFIRRAIAFTLLATAIAPAIPPLPLAGEGGPAKRDRVKVPPPTLLFLTGLLVGALVPLTSAGSGSLLTALLLTITAWQVPQLAATSNVFGWIAALLGFALAHQSFDATLFGLILIGLIPGVLAGAFLSHRINRRAFAPALSLFTFYLAIRLI